MDLYDRETSIEFYEDRYSQAYMDEWPNEKKERVLEIIRSLNLPKVGDALDFGCGTGVFTEVIKKALPKWNVHGTDISSSAIEKAKQRDTDCSFFLLSDKTLNTKFDFLFTHHVLEHVYNISTTIEEFNDLMKPSSSCLHILPCGNEFSFEYNICRLKKNGIDKERENRFFFEDEGHVRRLTTNQMNLLLGKYNYSLTKEYYSNQLYGGIDWIINSGTPLVYLITTHYDAKDIKSALKLITLRCWLLFLNIIKIPSNISEIKSMVGQRNITNYLRIFLIMSCYPLSLPFQLYIKKKAKEEWYFNKNQRNGSEMYLYYVRTCND